ncbi:hypothetical protein CNMCM6106_007171 [Aspergillus hiratsukae]|uniref:Uncharacterized protein n=1 Tax=Aspergillus hiratsukae TaxID=1194566 RepID=A0A8H6QHW7_9EURO|nr:hypothetical protein CNMCM6106_007171 [Aspergillus hiratsukae]
MRVKIQSMMDGRAADDRDFARLLSFPDHVAPDSSLADFTLDPEGTSSREMQLATDVRASIKASWKGQLDAAGARAGARANVAPSAGGVAVAPDAARTKRVQWSEGVEMGEEEQSEGEEEALEEAEMLEAQVAAAADAVEAAATAAEEEANDLDEELDEGGDMDVEPSKP